MVELLEDYYTDKLRARGIFFQKGKYNIYTINRIKYIAHTTVPGLYIDLKSLKYKKIDLDIK